MKPAFVLAAAGVLGCGPDAMRGPTPTIADVPTVELREVMRLGGADAPEHVSFRREPPLAVHRSGLIFALHARDARVAVLDSLGEFVRWIGRRGNGPGEFQNAFSMGFVGDTLWVRDSPAQRFSMFLLDGSLVSTERTPEYDFGYHLTWPPGISGYLAGGKAWVEAEGGVMGEDHAIDLPLLVGDRALAALDTLFTIPNPRGRVAGGVAFAPLPIPPYYDVATDGSAIALAAWSDTTPGTLAVHLFVMESGERRELMVPINEQPVPQTVRDSLIDAAVTKVREIGDDMRARGFREGLYPAPISRAEAQQDAYLPRYYPPIGDILVGLDGTLWLQRMDGVERGPWVALDASGTPLFAVRLPGSATLRQASRHALWATDRDSLDVPYLVRWNIQPR